MVHDIVCGINGEMLCGCWEVMHRFDYGGDCGFGDTEMVDVSLLGTVFVGHLAVLALFG